MALYTITGQEVGRDGQPGRNFVPRNARYSVYTLPDQFIVARGKSQSKSIPVDLEDGKYRAKVFKPGVANWEVEFYVGLTEQEWKLLDSRKTRWARVDHTTDGVRWTCKLCKETNMTKAGAIKHEWAEHLGLDPLKATEEEIDDAMSAPQPMAAPVGERAEAAEVIPPVTRRPGRPPKVATE